MSWRFHEYILRGELDNAALTAVAALDGSPLLAADRVAHYRAGLFKIREDIVALIARLRGER